MDSGNSDILALLATDLSHSYERLVSTYWYRLKVFVLRRMGSPQDAEDIVQEAFVQASLFTPRQAVTMFTRRSGT